MIPSQHGIENSDIGRRRGRVLSGKYAQQCIAMEHSDQEFKRREGPYGGGWWPA